VNSKRPTLKLFLVAFAATLLSAIVLDVGEAHACMCEVLSPEEQLRVSDAVFSGEVASVKEATSGDTSPSPETGLPVGGPITFEVEESWKGDMAKQVVVLGYGEGGSGCGVYAREGERYLVYARRGEDGTLRTSTCDGTKPLAAAKDDLRALGSSGSSLPASGGPSPAEVRAILVTVAATLSLLGLAGAVVLLRVPRRRGSA